MSTVWQPFDIGLQSKNLQRLEGMVIPDPSALQGRVVYVVDRDSYYSLSLTSGAPLDPINVRPTILGGASRWLRLNVNANANANKLLIASDVYIDAINGSDNANGTSPSTALKTFAEWQKRVGRGTVLSPAGGFLTIHILTDLPQNDPITFDNIMAAGTTATILGAMVLKRAGVFSATGNKDRAANQPWTVTDAALPGDWTPFLGQFIASGDGRAFIARDLGGKTAHVSEWDYPADTGGDGITFPVGAGPSPGDSYSVFDFVHVTLGRVVVGYSPEQFGPLVPPGGLLLMHLHFDRAGFQSSFPVASAPPETISAMAECINDNLIEIAAGTNNAASGNCCHRGGVFQFNGSSAFWTSGLFLPFQDAALGYPNAYKQEGGFLRMDGDVTFVGDPGTFTPSDLQVLGTTIAGATSFWDCQHGITCNYPGSFQSEQFSPLFGEFGYVPLWGDGNTDNLILNKISFEQFNVGAPPPLPSIVTGTGPGGAAVYVSPSPNGLTGHAFDQATATFFPAQPTTWANFNVATPAGFLEITNVINPNFTETLAESVYPPRSNLCARYTLVFTP